MRNDAPSPKGMFFHILPRIEAANLVTLRQIPAGFYFRKKFIIDASIFLGFEKIT
jgi:hypothetical protein